MRDHDAGDGNLSNIDNLLFHSFCFIKKIGPGWFEIDTSSHIESHHTLIWCRMQGIVQCVVKSNDAQSNAMCIEMTLHVEM